MFSTTIRHSPWFAMPGTAASMFTGRVAPLQRPLQEPGGPPASRPAVPDGWDEGAPKNRGMSSRRKCPRGSGQVVEGLGDVRSQRGVVLRADGERIVAVMQSQGAGPDANRPLKSRWYASNNSSRLPSRSRPLRTLRVGCICSTTFSARERVATASVNSGGHKGRCSGQLWWKVSGSELRLAA